MIIELILYENEWINNRSGCQTEDCLGGTNPEKKIENLQQLPVVAEGIGSVNSTQCSSISFWLLYSAVEIKLFVKIDGFF